MTPDDNLSQREAEVARLLQDAARTERAPAALRAEVDAMRADAARAGAHRRGRLRVTSPVGVGLRYASLATGAIAALAVALVLVLSGGGGELSIAQAAALATRGSAAPAPAPYPGAPGRLLSARVGDLRFPNWSSPQGWHSTGQRTDRVGGRTVTTVYYSDAGRKLAYSIVSAPVLSGLHTQGEPYAAMFRNGRTIVVWEERNHTCVLSAAGVSVQSLWKLAAATMS